MGYSRVKQVEKRFIGLYKISRRLGGRKYVWIPQSKGFDPKRGSRIGHYRRKKKRIDSIIVRFH